MAIANHPSLLSGKKGDSNDDYRAIPYDGGGSQG